MAHIVFTLNAYFPCSDANIVCANNVIAELIADGHHISCVCGTSEKPGMDTVNGISVYRVPHTPFAERYEKLHSSTAKGAAKFCHFLSSLFLLPLFPNAEPHFSRSLLRQLEKVNSIRKIDCVVGVFRPFAAVNAAIEYKKRHPDTVAVGYYLDILKGAVKPAGIPASLYSRLCDRGEKKAFSRLDRILMAENGRAFYENQAWFSALQNVDFVNFPTLIFGKTQTVSDLRRDRCKKLVYAGYMDKLYRNPILPIQSVLALRDRGMNVQLHLYGTSNLENEIRAYTQRFPDVIFYHGKVGKEEADKAIYSADYLLNIGNDIANIVPSKIFELFATGKPIVHFSDPALDATRPLFHRYPSCLIIDKNISAIEAADTLYAFFAKEHSPVSEDYLKKSFFSATPRAAAEKIEQEVAVRDRHSKP